MTPINLDEIIAKQFAATGEGDFKNVILSNTDIDKIKSAMLQFGKQLLAAAAENATLDEEAHHGGFAFTYTVNKDSITSVLDAVKR